MKKLVLNKKTIARLTEKQQTHIKGGRPKTYYCKTLYHCPFDSRNC